MKIYFLYKTTNQINNKFYVGAHSCNEITTDNYLGSGRTIKRSIKKYGKENFKREILAFFEDEFSLYEAEYTIVDEELINRANCYNETIGGTGGWFHVDNRGDKNHMKTLEGSSKVWKSRKANPIAVKKQTEIAKKNIKFAHEANKGKKRPLDVIEKIASANRGLVRTTESRSNLSLGQLKRDPVSEETKRKRSDNAKAEIAAGKNMSLLSKGKKRDDKFKLAISERMKLMHQNSIFHKCVYCGIESKLKTNIIRWHNENCRYK